MANIAALFSGQGSQYPGMGQELCDSIPEVREVYRCAEDILGMPVRQLSFSGSEEELAQTLNAQPLIFTHSVAAYTAASLWMEEPKAVAGHSLGEFAALCCAGAYSLEDGLRIIQARAKAMDAVSRSVSGAMYAVVGGDSGEIGQVCEATEGFVAPVNFNLPAQTVISGETAAAEAAAKALEESGKKVVRLSVSSAFHTKMMQPAADQFRDAVKDMAYNPVKIPFYSNLTGGRLEIADYPDYFARHMVSPVRFVEQMNALAADGIDTCVEFGPKKTAATLAKKNVRAFTVYNIEDAKTLEKAKSGLGA